MTSPLPKMLTTREVAELFRVDPRTVMRWAAAGVIPHRRKPSGRGLLYPEAEVQQLLRDGSLGPK